MLILGRKYLVDFGTAKAILLFESATALSFTITQKDALPANITEKVVISLLELRPEIFILSWKEASGTSVVQVHDHEAGFVHSHWVSAAGDLKTASGILRPYEAITVNTTINSSVESCWRAWTDPAEILLFNNPFDNWHTTRATIDLRNSGRFFYRMEAVDGSAGFDFAGSYENVLQHALIECLGDDGRKTIIRFGAGANETTITEVFEPDTITPLDVQQNFCQSVLDSFKRYMERRTGNS